jgi:hypothetical protein
LVREALINHLNPRDRGRGGNEGLIAVESGMMQFMQILIFHSGEWAV